MNISNQLNSSKHFYDESIYMNFQESNEVTKIQSIEESQNKIKDDSKNQNNESHNQINAESLNQNSELQHQNNESQVPKIEFKNQNNDIQNKSEQIFHEETKDNIQGNEIENNLDINPNNITNQSMELEKIIDGFDQSQIPNKNNHNINNPNINNFTLNDNNQNENENNEPKIYNVSNNLNKDLSLSNKHFLCKICMTVPTVKFDSYEIATLYCECGEKEKQISAINNLCLTVAKDVPKKGENRAKDYLYCVNHKDMNYLYFCQDHKENLCQLCLRETDRHKNCVILIFDQQFFEIDKKIKEISEFLKELNNENEDFKSLISVILTDYYQYPNHSNFININFCYYFLKSKIKNNKQEDNIQEAELLTINKIEQLNERKLDTNNIKEIKINNSIDNIDFLKNKFFNNLITLDLNNNKISTIEVLTKIKFPNLEVLNVACNPIDDSNIKYFLSLNLPSLTDLNVYQNRLTDIRFFTINNDKKMPKLRLLYAGFNYFNFSKETVEACNKHFDFSSVEEIGLSRKVFKNTTIKYLKYFNLKNCKELYLSDNNIKDLNFIEKLDLPKIEEIWLKSNEIEDFTPLKHLKTLKKIVLENNKINNIEGLDDFVNSFPKVQNNYDPNSEILTSTLKCINLNKNPISYEYISKEIVQLLKKAGIEISINPY